MKCAIVFASLLALVGAVAVPEKRADYPDCGPTSGDLYVPDSIKVGEKFSARYCSSQYSKTSSKSITLAIDAKGGKDVNGAVILTDELTSDNGKKYDFEAELPAGQTTFSGNLNLIVVEKINDYSVPSSYVVFTKEIKVGA
ncbi:hypothetical protein HDZ31DRAFT_83939 [Schizophyllum fasciatum]